MGLFDEVKENVTVRQAAEFYGFKITKSGLISCIFHNDKTPSMKVDQFYLYFEVYYGLGNEKNLYKALQIEAANRAYSQSQISEQLRLKNALLYRSQRNSFSSLLMTEQA